MFSILRRCGAKLSLTALVLALGIWSLSGSAAYAHGGGGGGGGHVAVAGSAAAVTWAGSVVWAVWRRYGRIWRRVASAVWAGLAGVASAVTAAWPRLRRVWRFLPGFLWLGLRIRLSVVRLRLWLWATAPGLRLGYGGYAAWVMAVMAAMAAMAATASVMAATAATAVMAAMVAILAIGYGYAANAYPYSTYGVAHAGERRLRLQLGLCRTGERDDDQSAALSSVSMKSRWSGPTARRP